MIISAQHRSYALALRHLRELRRKYPSAELLSRRNARGRYSSRGQFYEFEVTEETQQKIELVLHFDYSSTAARDLLRFQVHVIGPGNVSDDEALRVVREHFTKGGKYPKGWREKAIYWGHVQPWEDVERPIGDDFRVQGLRDMVIAGGEGTVARKRTIKTRRRAAKRKAKK